MTAAHIPKDSVEKDNERLQELQLRACHDDLPNQAAHQIHQVTEQEVNMDIDTDVLPIQASDPEIVPNTDDMRVSNAQCEPMPASRSGADGAISDASPSVEMPPSEPEAAETDVEKVDLPSTPSKLQANDDEEMIAPQIMRSAIDKNSETVIMQLPLMLMLKE
eukprot:s19_g25.t1